MKAVVYIAGKMTGLPDLGRARFASLEKHLTENGYAVLNPGRMPDDMPQERYMPICMAMIDQSDAVVMMTGWETSKGANLEREYARYQGKQIIYQHADGRKKGKA